MNRIMKRSIVYSLVGILQIGFGAALTEASPVYPGDGQAQTIRMDRPQGGGEDRRREHDRREREENERHEREMKRRPHEGDREWHERQERERKRHEQALREIAAFLLGVITGQSSK